jgi:hypothetical protein
MSTLEDDKKQLEEVIAYKDAMLAILRAKSIDPTAFEASANETINDFAAACVSAKAETFCTD